MYILDPVIVESRLSVVKSFKEADELLEFKVVLDQNRPDLHSLGTLVKSHIDKLYTRYLSVGITFDEFYEDLIESLLRSGFVHDRKSDVDVDSPQGAVKTIFCGLDEEYPYSQVFLAFSLTR